MSLLGKLGIAAVLVMAALANPLAAAMSSTKQADAQLAFVAGQ